MALVTIAVAADEFEAEEICTRLAQAGIESVVEPRSEATGDLAELRVLVDAGTSDAASDVLLSATEESGASEEPYDTDEGEPRHDRAD
jgi:hypothetical protein